MSRRFSRLFALVSIAALSHLAAFVARADEVLSNTTSAATIANPANPVNPENSAAGKPEAPNLILLMVDDLRALELDLGFGQTIETWPSALQEQLIDRGTRFENFFNTTPLCCPSRASFLTGRYAHNHGIHGNNYLLTDGHGGWRRFWELGHEKASIGSWLQEAGYDTVLIGKFLNGYPNKPFDFVAENYVPPGWNEWYASFLNEGFVAQDNFLEPPWWQEFSYTSFRMNENGTVMEYTDGTHLTDLERSHAVDYVERVAPGGQPFFMYLAPFAPHGPTEPADRHLDFHGHVSPQPPPSWNEADLSDKPLHIQDGAQSTANFFGAGYQHKLDMTLALDELVAALVHSLKTTGVMDNTYIFFVSDNGLMAGEHGIGGKSAPYEESIRIPMLVRGPGVPEGVIRQELVANIDLAPTLLELAGAAPRSVIDGESMVRLWKGSPRDKLTGPAHVADWRDAVCVELLTEIASTNQNHVVPPYVGLRGNRHKQVLYETDERELYDLVTDPFEMDSFHDLASVELVATLDAAREDFANCAGEACRDASRRGWPRASFAVSCEGLICAFESTSSDPDGALVTHAWNFGDGSPADSNENPSYTFPAGGYFSVTLQVLDDDGQPGLATQELLIDPLFVDGFESGTLDAWSADSEPAAAQ